MAKPILGRGLNALLAGIGASGQPAAPDPMASSETVQRVPVARIRSSPLQPRQDFSAESLRELADSIQEQGIVQPLLVRPKDDHFELIAGERRWRAAQLLGLAEVPVIVRQADDRAVLELALIENLQRTDLSPLEEAEGYRRLQEEFGMTQEQIAQKVGKDRATVANAMRLLKLSPEVRAMLASGELSAGHARVLASLPTPLEQYKWAEKIVRQGFNVRDVEKWLQDQKGPTRKGKSAGKGKDANIAKLEENLRNWLGTKVTVRTKGRQKGTVYFEYYSLDDLDRILNLFRKSGYR
jgi:ParB family chromosome partitioning protein